MCFLAWVVQTAVTHKYGKNASWGLCTLDKNDAYEMAALLGFGVPVHDSVKQLGYYSHYHVKGRILFGEYKHFHVWYWREL